MKKKQLSIVLAMLMLSTAFVACGGSQKDDVSADAKSETATEVSEVNTAEKSSEASIAEKPASDEIFVGDALSETSEEFVGDAPADEEYKIGRPIIDEETGELLYMTGSYWDPVTTKITSTQIIDNPNISSAPNYCPANELGFENIPSNYEWLIQNRPEYREVVFESDEQILINNQALIFAAWNKVKEENGFGDILDITYSKYDVYTGSDMFGNFRLIIYYKSDSADAPVYCNGFSADTVTVRLFGPESGSDNKIDFVQNGGITYLTTDIIDIQ